MSILDSVLKHRTIRKYKSDDIPENILSKVLEAAARGATTGNMQLYSIIITKDADKRQALAPLHFNQPMVAQAPVILTFCADLNRFHKWCAQRQSEKAYDNFMWFCNGMIDATIAAQNAVVAAESFGLGTVYLGTTTYTADKIIDFFNLPEGVVPVTTVVLGYPDETPPLTDRLPIEAVVHHETYKDYNPKAIDDLYEAKEKLQQTKELIAENEVENLAQVFVQKRYKKTDNIHFSKVYLDVIKKQGFMNQ